MDLILNTPILGLNSRPLRFQTAQTAHTPTLLEQPVTAPLSFGELLLRTLSQKTTSTDDEATTLYTLCQTINTNLLAAEGTVLTVSDSDYTLIKAVIDQQPVVVKARFIEMVNAKNATA